MYCNPSIKCMYVCMYVYKINWIIPSVSMEEKNNTHCTG